MIFIGNSRFENQNEVLSILLQILTSSTTHNEIDRIENFAQENRMNIKIALKDAKLNLQWADQNIPIIMDVLKQIH